MARVSSGWLVGLGLLGCPSHSTEPAHAVNDAHETPKRTSLDDQEDLTRLLRQADACAPGAADAGCVQRVRTVVVLTVAADGSITDAVVPNQGQLDVNELVCIADVFRQTRFTRLPRPPRFDLPITVCR